MPTESVQQQAAALRKRAEARAVTLKSPDLTTLSPDETARLLHELRVYQIELEMQNEELLRAQVALEGLRARYFDLYHLAPVGYLSLGEKGLILEANLRAAALLGLPSATLVKRALGRFIHPDDADDYYLRVRQLWRTGQPQACEVRLAPRREGAAPTWVRLELVLAQDEQERATVCRVILNDISERKRGEAALREREARQRLILDHLSVGVVFADIAGTAFYVNPTFTELFGYTLAQIPTLADWWPLAHPEPADREPIVAEWNRRLAEALASRGETRPMEAAITCADGAQKHVRITARVIGEHLFVTFIDLTERRAADEALRGSESRYRDLYENAPVAYFSVGTDGRIRRCNRQAAHMLGATVEQLAGRPVFDFYPETQHGKAKARQVFGRFLAGEPVADEELQMVRADGTSIWINLSVTAIRDAAGQVVESRSAVVDITKRKAAEEALAASEERYRMLLMLSPDGVSVADQTGRILTCNAEFAHMYGFDNSAEAIGRYAQELATPEAFAGLYREVAAALERGESVVRGVEVEVLRRDGSPFPAEYSIAPIPWPDASFGVAYLSNIRDITRRKEEAAELEQHRLRLEELVQARTRDLRAEIAERAATQAALGRSEAGLVAAERIAHMGSWEWDLLTGELHMSDGLYRILGFDPGTDPRAVYAATWEAVHPHDTAAARAAILRAQETGAPLDLTFRIARPAGEMITLRMVAEFVRDAAGRPVFMQGTAQDITEQTAVFEALRRSEASLAEAERIAGMGSWERDAVANESYWSAELYNLFGIPAGTPPNIGYETIRKQVHPDDERALQAEMARVLQSEDSVDYTYRVIRPSGETRFLHSRTKRVLDAEGRFVRTHGIVQDITEQEQTKAALARQAEELTGLQELGQFVSLSLPLNEVIETYLDRLLTMADLDLAQMFLLREGRLHLAGGRSTLAGPAAQTQVLDVYECLCGQAVQEGRILYAAEIERDLRCTNRQCHANGLHSVAALPLRSGEAIIGALAVAAVAPDAFAERLIFLETAANLIAARLQNALLHQEVQARAAALEATVIARTRELQTERDRTQAILETVGESVVVTDLDGEILFVNPATTALTGRTRDDELGQPLWQGWTPQTRAKIWPDALAAVRGSRAWHGEISGTRKNGTAYTAGLTGTPLYDGVATAAPVGAVWVQRDVTKAKEAEQLKDRFVSNVSHELRTPISIIALSCDNLEAYHERLDEGQRRQILQDIHEQAHLLNRLIEDILTVSQIDSGRLPAARTQVDLARVFREEVRRQQPLAEKRSQYVAVNAAPPVMVLGNEAQLCQIIRNLLDNAIKYTPVGGQIHCSCEARTSAQGPVPRDAADREAGWAVLEFTDEGIGIAPKDLPYLFERFYRVNGESETPGTGLGLPIAQELVQWHGGWINVASTPGEGSTFTVYLPLASEE